MKVIVKVILGSSFIILHCSILPPKKNPILSFSACLSAPSSLYVSFCFSLSFFSSLYLSFCLYPALSLSQSVYNFLCLLLFLSACLFSSVGILSPLSVSFSVTLRSTLCLFRHLSVGRLCLSLSPFSSFVFFLTSYPLLSSSLSLSLSIPFSPSLSLSSLSLSIPLSPSPFSYLSLSLSLSLLFSQFMYSPLWLLDIIFLTSLLYL